MGTDNGQLTVKQLLSGLNDGIGTDEFKSLLAQISDSDLNESEKLALRSIHRKLLGFRTKESVLRALFDTATDLTSIHDADEIMAMVVKRTRLVMGTDMAYLSLNNFETGTTYIRETDGVSTQAYRDIKMPFGYGILGSVAHANGPYQTTDYAKDESVAHIPEIDAAVKQEGVKSILGAPLRSSGRVIGALLVADRTIREFRPDEVDAIESLAGHAAVVFENARLFNDLHKNLARLEEAIEQSQTYVSELEAIADAEQRLIGTLSASGGLAHFQKVLHSLIKKPLQVIEHVPGNPVPETAWLSLTQAKDAINRSSASGEPVETVLEDALSGEPAVITTMATVLGDGYVGGSFVAGKLDTSSTLILQRSSVTLAALFSFQRSMREIDVREQAEIIEDLVSDRPGRNPEVLERRVVAFGIDPSRPNFVLVADPGPTEQSSARSILARQLRGSGLVSLHKGRVRAIVGLENAEAMCKKLLRALEQSGIPATIAYSEIAKNLDSIPERYALAESISDSLRALGRTGEIANRSTLGAAGLIVGRAPHELSHEIVRSTLGPIIDYDEIHGSDLMATTIAYFDSNMNVPSTAKTLHVHSNTVRQRLDRIDQVLGSEWRQGTRALDGHLAARIWQLQHQGAI